MVIVLSLIATLAYVDRALLSLVVKPIKAELHLPDVTMSLLFGTTFAVGYCVSNVPAGYLADRMDRRLVLVVAAISWAIMTMAFGLSATAAQLFACRVGVGIAEGVISPVAFSLIRDGIAPARRPRGAESRRRGRICGLVVPGGPGAMAGDFLSDRRGGRAVQPLAVAVSRTAPAW